MDVLGDVLKGTHEPNDFSVVTKLNKEEQQRVCTNYDQVCHAFNFCSCVHLLTSIQFTSDFLDLAFKLHLVSIGIDANTKDITKRVLYVAEQWFFGFYYLGDGPLEKLVPLCSKKAQANTNKILEEIKVLIRVYGRRTDCSRVGGPLVNLQRTCPGGHDVSELPGGIITKRRTEWKS